MVFCFAVLRRHTWQTLALNKPKHSSQMSSSIEDSILRTADGEIDLARYEVMWNKQEDVPGINFNEQLRGSVLLAKVREQLPKLPALIERNFTPILHEGDTVNGCGDGQCVRIMQWNILADGKKQTFLIYVYQNK